MRYSTKVQMVTHVLQNRYEQEHSIRKHMMHSGQIILMILSKQGLIALSQR